MSSTNYSVGSSGMIMRSGCNTGYYVSGSNILKGGSFCNLSVGNDGRILKSGSDTGYVIRSGSIIKDSDKGHSIDWIFN
jgi:hypothetical protein